MVKKLFKHEFLAYLRVVLPMHIILLFIALFNHADFAKTDFSYMRTGIMAGANCPADLMRRAADEMNM